MNDPNKFFVMISPFNVAVESEPQDIFNSIYNRLAYPCEVATFPTIEEANLFAVQRNYYLGVVRSDEVGLLQIPISGTFSTGILPPKTQQAIMNDEEFYAPSMDNLVEHASENISIHYAGMWSISAINGYAVATDLNSLMNFLVELPFKYIYAVYFENVDLKTVENHARHSYCARFYNRYSATEQFIALPSQHLEVNQYFIDPKHEQREKSLNNSEILHNLQTFGML